MPPCPVVVACLLEIELATRLGDFHVAKIQGDPKQGGLSGAVICPNIVPPLVGQRFHLGQT